MYTTIVHTTVDMARLDQAVAGIEGVKQRLSAARGFRGAYWLAPNDGHGMSVTLWEDEAAARSAAFPVGSSPAPGVTVDRIDIRPIIAQA
jgi:hypothetical protein